MYLRQRAKNKYAIAECNHKVQTNERNEANIEKAHTTRNRNTSQAYRFLERSTSLSTFSGFRDDQRQVTMIPPSAEDQCWV